MTQPTKIFFNNANDEAEMSDSHGKEIEILNVLADKDDGSVMEPLDMPHYHIKLVETGAITTAYPNEIACQCSDTGALVECSTPEMDAVLTGQNAYRVGVTANQFKGALALRFNQGLALGEFKQL
jgi:hypothetical protein